jgi:hypothetical protein
MAAEFVKKKGASSNILRQEGGGGRKEERLNYKLSLLPRLARARDSEGKKII